MADPAPERLDEARPPAPRSLARRVGGRLARSLRVLTAPAHLDGATESPAARRRRLLAERQAAAVHLRAEAGQARANDGRWAPTVNGTPPTPPTEPVTLVIGGAGTGPAQATPGTVVMVLPNAAPVLALLPADERIVLMAQALAGYVVAQHADLLHVDLAGPDPASHASAAAAVTRWAGIDWVADARGLDHLGRIPSHVLGTAASVIDAPATDEQVLALHAQVRGRRTGASS